MLWGKKALQVTAALAVAFGAAHTAEKLKAPAVEQSLLQTAADLAVEDLATKAAGSSIPESASLRTPTGSGVAVTGITSVAATTSVLAGEECEPRVNLSAMTGAMIEARISAPCNRGERVVVRHSGLSFSTQTGADGQALVVLPALRTEAMVAFYLQDSRLLLGRITVPDASSYARYAVIWDSPAELDLRVTDGDKVLVAGAPVQGGDQRVMAFGQDKLPDPVLAQVYSVPGSTLDGTNITVELRITPQNCGRTLRFDSVQSVRGIASQSEQTVSVPLCGTAGDILVLKNLAPTLTLAAPK
jgi:hypothetical protein